MVRELEEESVFVSLCASCREKTHIWIDSLNVEIIAQIWTQFWGCVPSVDWTQYMWN